MPDPALAYALLRATYDDKVRNPVDAVIPIIKRALFRYGGKYLTHSDLQNRIINVWGLEIPLNVIQYSLPRLASQNIVIFDQNVHQYKLVDPLYSDPVVIEAEELARTKYDRALQNIEAVLIDLEIDSLTSAEVIDAWLDTSSLSFLGGINPARSAGTEDWLINRIIVNALNYYVFSKILAEDLTDIALGDSLYRAVKSLTEFNTNELDVSDLRQRMDNVDVYLDTQIVICAFGYSRTELNQAASELLEMCKRTGCKLKVFNHTVDELESIVRNAVSTLESAWSHSERRSGYDIVAYARENGLQSKDLISLVVNIPTRLAELQIETVDAPSVLKDITLSVDEGKLIEDLKRELYGQSEKARNTDLDSITAIYRLRGGKSHKYLERCEAIFITSNKGLSDVATRYFQSHFRDISPHQVNIVQHVMTNVVFATRLWPKLPTNSFDIPRKQIIAYSVSNLVPSSAAQESFVAEIKSLVAAGRLSEHQAVAVEISRHLDECIFREMRSPTQQISRTQALHIINEISRLDARNREKRDKEIDAEAAESIRLLRIENERLRVELRVTQANKKITNTDSVAVDDAEVSKKEGHLVILTHGINTYAHWMDNITPALTGSGFKVAKAGHGVMSVPRFLSPVARFQNLAVKRVVGEIRSALDRHKPKHVSIIAHSFGTYVVAQIVKDYPEFKWKRIIFCGSVVRSDFQVQ